MQRRRDEKKTAALLRDCEKNFQDHPAFAYCDEEEVRQVSFREFLEDVKNRRAVYREIREERIGLWAGNSYRWIVAATSLLLEGKTVVLLDANLTDEDAAGCAAVRYADGNRRGGDAGSRAGVGTSHGAPLTKKR